MGDTKSVQSITDSLDELMNEVNKYSAVDTSRQTSEEIKKDTTSSTQDNLGVEQSQEAAKGGATAGKQNKSEKSKETGDAPEEDINTVQMDVDKKTEGNSKVMNKVKKESITPEQKQEKMASMAENVLNLLENLPEAEQTGNSKEAGQDEMVIPAGLEQKEFEGMIKTANGAAGNYFSDFLQGMVKRAQDAKYIKELNLDQKVLNKLGGVDGILDKLAAENPEAVLPPEVLNAAGPAAEAPAGSATAEAPAGSATAEAPVEESVPAEAPVEGGGEEDLDAMAEAMAALGITPEILEQAMQLIEDLKSQGYSEDQIGEAAAAMLEEQAASAEAPAEEGVPEAPAEAPAKVPAESSTEKVPVEEEKVAMDKVKQKLSEKVASANKGKSVNTLKKLISQKMEG